MSDYIRNFAIIAHIDHGKSTLADRFLEFTGALSKREMKDQTLDSMDLERERGITIKSSTVTMYFTTDEGVKFTLNLIDTPGHVDFAYEVSRALAACEGALLIIDATQGIQAQTLANMTMALEKDLVIIPVINKIDLPAADVNRVLKEIEELLGIPNEECILCSAKTGEGIEDIMKAIIKYIPAPRKLSDDKLCLVFDSFFDNYRGVISYIRVYGGSVRKGDKIKMLSTGESFEVTEVGLFIPKLVPATCLTDGQVGYITANIKNPYQIKIGDTIVDRNNKTLLPLSGFKIVKPVVFAGIYPADTSSFDVLENAFAKLKLNDSSISIEKESSATLGCGFRCGFLGLLHLEIIIDRLKREYDIDVITCSPSVVYKCDLVNSTEIDVNSPTLMPDRGKISVIKEPWVVSKIITPVSYLSQVMALALDKRGIAISTDSIDGNRVINTYHFPLNEIITDFSDRLKSCTKGFASFDYEILDYRKGDIVKITILINGEQVDAFTALTHRGQAERKGRSICEKLAETIPKSLIKVAIQALIDGKIVARTTISALSKDVTAKCYGGDITRKRKLWDKQKEGKKRMRQFGKVNVPHSTFITIIKNSTI